MSYAQNIFAMRGTTAGFKHPKRRVANLPSGIPMMKHFDGAALKSGHFFNNISQTKTVFGA
jgi:hypothetical protein